MHKRQKIMLLGALASFAMATAANGEVASHNPPMDRPLKVVSGTEALELAGNFDYLEDEHHSYSAQDVIGERGQDFVHAKLAQSEIGFTRSAYWLRFQLANDGNSNSRWVFELWTVPTDRADLYVVRNGRAVHTAVTGNQIAGAARKASYYPLELNLQDGERQTVLMRLESAQRMRAPINLWAPHALAQRDDNKQAAMFLLFGIGLGLLIYNLFLFLSLRERSYLYYVVYSFCAWTLILGENGYVDHYLGAYLPWHWARVSSFMMLVTLSMMIVFGNSFLEMSKKVSSRASKLLGALACSGLLLAALSLFTLGSSQSSKLGILTDVFVVATVIALVVSGVAAVRKSLSRSPQFFLLAWSSFFAMVIVWVAEANGFIPMNLFTRFGVEVGLALEGLLMSLALANRLHESRLQLQQLLTIRNEKLEESIQLRTVELRKALESRDDFISVASHELKTPLTALSLHLDLAARQAESEVKGSVLAARGQIGKISDLIERLFDVTRIRSGVLAMNRVHYDLCKLVQDVVDRLQVLADSSRIQIRVVFDSEVIFGYWDAPRIEQVLTNLISNAFKYGGGQDVDVAVSHSVAEVWVRVIDHGSGISVEAQQRIFDRFHRDLRPGKQVPGLGLGLYVSKKISEAHGGSLEVESRPGGGSTFVLRLPRQDLSHSQGSSAAVVEHPV